MALTGMVCSGILFCAGAGFLYARPWTAVTNHLQTDIVDISMVEYQQEKTADGIVRTPWKDDRAILPGDRISLIPEITNQGADCYVRARVTCSGGLKDLDLVPFGMQEDWFLAEDGYFYYKDVLSEKSSTELFSGVTVSDAVNDEVAGTKGYLSIWVDAIQSRNFTPEFQSENPWGNVKILKNQKNSGSHIRVMTEAEKQEFQILWQGDMKKLITNADDFFANLPELLPGEVLTDQICVSNPSDMPMEIYFRSDAPETGHALLAQIGLKIELQNQGKRQLIYDGNLQANDLKEEISLGTVQANEEAEFVYTLSVPKTLDNQWTLLNEDVTWYFSTESMQQENTKSAHMAISNTVKTGDTLPKTCMVVAVISFIVCMILLPCQERRQQRHDAT